MAWSASIDKLTEQQSSSTGLPVVTLGKEYMSRVGKSDAPMTDSPVVGPLERARLDPRTGKARIAEGKSPLTRNIMAVRKTWRTLLAILRRHSVGCTLRRGPVSKPMNG